MSNQKIKTRVQNKYDFKENWDKASFAPLKGELIIVAPKANSESNTGLVNESVPHRVKIGNGSSTLAELPYLNYPKVNQAESDSVTLYGFDSVTTLQPGNATLNLRFDQTATNSIANYEAQEFIHHKIFASVDTSDATKRTITITLNITGDGTDVVNGIHAEDINIFFKPSKCTMAAWHTGNTVTSQKATLLPYKLLTNLPMVTAGNFAYTLTLPNDKDTESAFIFNDGRFSIDISCFINKQLNNIDIIIENEYLACCSRVKNY
jgi:hypothetical protein